MWWETFKSSEGAEEYSAAMARNRNWRIEFFWEKIERILKKTSVRLNLLDIWACDGSLLIEFDGMFWERIQSIWIEVSNELARLDASWRVMQWDWYSLDPVTKDSQDIITYSRTLHELGSFFWSKYSRDEYVEWVMKWLKAWYRVLKKDGIILIADPVQPRRPREVLTIKIQGSVIKEIKLFIEQHLSDCVSTDGKISNLDNFLSKLNEMSPNDIPYALRLIYFMHRFPWSLNQYSYDSIFEININRWLLMEAIRHMSWMHSREEFEDELHEWHGSLNVDEWALVENELWYKVVEHVTTFERTKKMIRIGENFEIYENKVQVPSIFISETQQFTVLKK